ncbi:hypothetical protein R3P38DRAFT_2680390 [Favolaschia claudopus]|uniref:F-box domain-containing protein n=1 Tax=Favolaschia claudopus TaxID=2862362 RepID=A0AAW0DXL6_9AGAR
MRKTPNLADFDRQVKETPDLKLNEDWDLMYNFIHETVDNCRNIFMDNLELERLRSEVSQLKHANNVLLLKLAKHCRSDYSAFPDEILYAIFRAALPPTWLLYGTKSVAPYALNTLSSDIRIKSSIAAVCKSWNRVGTEILYERVILRRITQLPVLACALESRTGLGALIKHLDFDSFVPRGYSNLHKHETERILALCPNLSHLGFSPPCVGSRIPYSLPTVASSVTSVEYNRNIPYSAILPTLISLSPTLVCVTFALPKGHIDEHPVIEYPKLKALHLLVDNDSVVPPLKWSAPQLRHLWICGFDVTRELTATHLNSLFDACGPTITFLRIHSIGPIQDIQALLDRCPILEHLTLDFSPTMTHKQVKFLDFFIEYNDPPRPISPISKEDFPALENCRHLEVIMASLPYIPREAGEAIFHHFTDPTSVNGDAFVRYDTSEDYDPGEEESNDDSDSDYIFDSDEDDEGSDVDEESSESDEEDDSDSDTASCITVSDTGCLLDEFYQGEYWEIGRDEALTVFNRTRTS